MRANIMSRKPTSFPSPSHEPAAPFLRSQRPYQCLYLPQGLRPKTSPRPLSPARLKVPNLLQQWSHEHVGWLRIWPIMVSLSMGVENLEFVLRTGLGRDYEDRRGSRGGSSGQNLPSHTQPTCEFYDPFLRLSNSELPSFLNPSSECELEAGFQPRLNVCNSSSEDSRSLTGSR